MSKRRLDAMIEEATVDCYNESEEAGGWFAMIEEHLKVPFETRLLGICVIVDRVDINRYDELVAICRRDKHRQTIPIHDRLSLCRSRPVWNGLKPTADGCADATIRKSRIVQNLDARGRAKKSGHRSKIIDSNFV